ncbi:MAG: glycosyltransferase [candidate division KSB1 bacterium]|nr:glycosyltransferase [candidate division KSB1 bacterium]
MRVSGLTIVRNIQIMDYPALEAIRSVLPLCDEFIVVVGKSEDATLDLIRGLGDSRIRIIETFWDPRLREGGRVLSQQTNLGLQHCTGDWVFYIQADEVLHEKYLDRVRSRMTRYLADPRVEGLWFAYRHFYGTYWAYQDNRRRWYRRQVRIVRRHPEIVSWGDAMDFRHRDGSPLRTRPAGAEIYHYGWVKSPERMLQKKRELDRWWHSDEEIAARYGSLEAYMYPDRYFLVPFRGTHPAVMKDRVQSQDWEITVPWTPLRLWPVRKLAVWLEPLTKRLGRVVQRLRRGCCPPRSERRKANRPVGRVEETVR